MVLPRLSRPPRAHAREEDAQTMDKKGPLLPEVGFGPAGNGELITLLTKQICRLAYPVAPGKLLLSTTFAQVSYMASQRTFSQSPEGDHEKIVRTERDSRPKGNHHLSVNSGHQRSRSGNQNCRDASSDDPRFKV